MGEASRRPRSTSARRNDYCAAGCGIKVFRGDRVVPFGHRVVHLDCVQAYKVIQRGWMTQARREIFWTVPCPECGAAALVGCSEDGQARPENHRARMSAYSDVKAQGLRADQGKLEQLRTVRARV